MREVFSKEEQSCRKVPLWLVDDAYRVLEDCMEGRQGRDLGADFSGTVQALVTTNLPNKGILEIMPSLDSIH